MSWSASAGGKKAEVRAIIESQCDGNIRNGFQTEAQKAAVLAAIDATPGDLVSCTAAGHNSSDVQGEFSMQLQGQAALVKDEGAEA